MDLVELRVLALGGLIVVATLSVGAVTAGAALSRWVRGAWRAVVTARRAARTRPGPRPSGEAPGPVAGAAAMVLRRQAWWRLRC